MAKEWAWYDANEVLISNIENDLETLVSPQTRR